MKKFTSPVSVQFGFNTGALWLGAHWSAWNRRLCINLLPMLTISITLPGGATVR